MTTKNRSIFSWHFTNTQSVLEEFSFSSVLFSQLSKHLCELLHKISGDTVTIHCMLTKCCTDFSCLWKHWKHFMIRTNWWKAKKWNRKMWQKEAHFPLLRVFILSSKGPKLLIIRRNCSLNWIIGSWLNDWKFVYSKLDYTWTDVRMSESRNKANQFTICWRWKKSNFIPKASPLTLY